ncbi:MAG: glycosyltransferase family 4 protein [Actinomycetota bacterium]
MIVCPYAWDRVGGVQSHVGALGRTLRERGHDIQILAPSSMTLTHQLSGSTDVKLVGRAVGIPANGSVAPLAFGPLAAAGVRVAIRDFEPDVLHLHEPLIPSLSFLALINSRIPSVGTFHAAADKSIGYRLAKPLVKRAGARLTVKTAVSEAARALIEAHLPGEYVLTPNGVERARFSDAEPLPLEGDKKVLFLGRLEKRKGLEVLIQAMARMADLGATLFVAGTGPGERACRRLASDLGVDVIFLGRLSDDDLPRAYKSCDVYCAPGLGGESFGIVLVEAMAAGAPIVCSDLPGYRSVSGGVAALVPPGDAGVLADELRAVLTDQVRSTAMRKKSLQLSQMFDWPRLAGGVEEAYRRAAAAKPHP